MNPFLNELSERNVIDVFDVIDHGDSRVSVGGQFVNVQDIGVKASVPHGS